MVPDCYLFLLSIFILCLETLLLFIKIILNRISTAILSLQLIQVGYAVKNVHIELVRRSKPAQEKK